MKLILCYNKELKYYLKNIEWLNDFFYLIVINYQTRILFQDIKKKWLEHKPRHAWLECVWYCDSCCGCGLKKIIL